MAITTVFFDLDGTLLPMDQETFTKGYFSLLAAKLAPHGYDPNGLVTAIWSGVRAMVQNAGDRLNEDIFWEKFVDTYGEKALDDKPYLAEFYATDFQRVKDYCGFNPRAAETVRRIKAAGYRVVLATNPIFPAIATESRIRWAGLEPSDFELYTTYENSRSCKPNPQYYQNILTRLGLKPEECLMVGNDVTEDMVAETLGMQTFLLTDCLINKEEKDISAYRHGGLDDLQALLGLEK